MKEYRERNGDRGYYEEHREEINLANKQKWKENSAWKEAHSKQSTSWYVTNKTDPEFLARRTVNSKKHYDATKSTPEYKFDYYRRCSSGRRKIAFELTYDQFLTFWQKPCTYCKDPIDTKGYLLSNVAPCCRTCNVMKQKLSVTTFISHIRKILS